MSDQTEALSVSGTQAIVTETDIEQLGGGSLTAGSTIGSSTSYLSVYGVTPVVQAAALTAVATTANVTTGGYMFGDSTQAAALITATNSIITALKNFGITL